MNYLITIALSAIMGVFDGIAKQIFERLEPVEFTVYRILFTFPIFLILLFFFPAQIPSLERLGIVVLVAIVNAVAYFGFIKALEKGKAGVVIPISSSRIIVAALLSFLILGEKFTLPKLAVTLVIFLGLILLTAKFEDIKSGKLISLKDGVGFALLSAVGWGLALPLIGQNAAAIGIILNSVILEFFGWLLQIGIWKSKGGQFKLNYIQKNYHYLIFFSVFVLLIFFGMQYVLTLPNVSVNVAIISSSIIYTTLYSLIFNKEKLTTQQYVAFCIVTFGVVAFSFT